MSSLAEKQSSLDYGRVRLYVLYRMHRRQSSLKKNQTARWTVGFILDYQSSF
jgi:hypothetical protein